MSGSNSVKQTGVPCLVSELPSCSDFGMSPIPRIEGEHFAPICNKFPSPLNFPANPRRCHPPMLHGNVTTLAVFPLEQKCSFLIYQYNQRTRFVHLNTNSQWKRFAVLYTHISVLWQTTAHHSLTAVVLVLPCSSPAVFPTILYLRGPSAAAP